MEPCPYRQGEQLVPLLLALHLHAAMEPCPYRQGEDTLPGDQIFVLEVPQWSPALIGRERRGDLSVRCAPVWWPQWSPALIGRESPVAVEVGGPGGERRNGALPLSAGRVGYVGSGAAVASEAAMEPCPYRQGEFRIAFTDVIRLMLPQWSPALIGRERNPPTCRPAHRCSGRNGALPLSAGRGWHLGAVAAARVAAMEPCPYRQGERSRTTPPVRTATRGRNGALPLSAGRDELQRALGIPAGRRNGALPLSAGRGLVIRGDVCDTDRAAMEPCPYRQGEAVPAYPQRYETTEPQWSPALIGRERRSPPPTGTSSACRNGALPLSAGRADADGRPGGRYLMPQWSPALIGRESHLIKITLVNGEVSRNGALPLSAGRDRTDTPAVRHMIRAAMEPCPYRQGEQSLAMEMSVDDQEPQWSPALIGRERVNTSSETSTPAVPQWSPALIGRERSRGPSRWRAPTGSRNGALPLSAGRVGRHGRLAPRRRRAAMEPCPYRQGEGVCPADAGARPRAAMEPCPYRQGEGLIVGEQGVAVSVVKPQWSPALIGRERTSSVTPVSARCSGPQWSPALIGRESRLAADPQTEEIGPQWSPALIGRERR